MNEFSLDNITFARLLPLRNTQFRVCADAGQEVKLRLIEATESPSLIMPHAKGPTRRTECFSLLFEGPATPFLEQKNYTFEHDQLGKFLLFTVPVGKTAEGFQYEVIINRLV